MFLVRLYMKSTNVIEFKTNKLETETDKLTGALVGITYNYADKDKRLGYIDISQIEAIVVDEID